MAITKSLPRVEVTIVARGIGLVEHQNEEVEDSANHIVRYIQAASNQTFEVHMRVRPGAVFNGDCMSFLISLDGNVLSKKLVNNRREVQTVGFTRVSQGCEMPGGMIRKYEFADLDKSGEEPKTKDRPAELKDLGTIRVEVHHKRKVHRSEIWDRSQSMKDIGAVSEKELKGATTSHSVQLAEAVPKAKQGITWKADYVDPTEKPAAVYEFRYRSREALKSEFIIPRTPSPEPEVPLEKRDLDSLTREELVELARRTQPAQREREEKPKIKREAVDDEPKRRKRPRPSEDITTIELDGDGNFVQETTTPRSKGPSEPAIKLE